MEILIYVYVKSDNNGKRKSYVEIESKYFLWWKFIIKLVFILSEV